MTSFVLLQHVILIYRRKGEETIAIRVKHNLYFSYLLQVRFSCSKDTILSIVVIYGSLVPTWTSVQ